MIEVTSAIKYARQYAADLLQGEEYENIKLEEVVFDEDNNEWHITLGYDSPVIKEIQTPDYQINPASVLASRNLFNEPVRKENIRTYKKFRIDAEDGKFKGMLIREVG